MDEKHPNILLVFTDQMRGQAMSCAEPHNNGPETNVYTPHLDAMAAGGVRFTNACSTNPICVPFRFSLWTGQRSVTRNVPCLHYRMSPTERTMAHSFNNAGYHTAYFGKWHLYAGPMGGNIKGYIPPTFRGGFREWHGFDVINNHFQTDVWHGEDREPTRHEGHQTDVLFDLVDGFVRREHDKPFLAALSIEPPHPPFTPTEESRQRQSQRRIVARPNVPAPGDHPPDPNHLMGMSVDGWLADHETHARNYYAMIEHIDDRVGGLLQTLQQTGRDRDTYVLFFSDHGEMLGSHHRFNKHVPYEESINVPFIVQGPDIRADCVTDLPICTEDIFPTVSGLCGVAGPTPAHGIDLSGFLRGRDTGPDRDAVVLECVDEIRQTSPLLMRMPWRAVRTSRYSFAALQHKPWLLFDLYHDPYQLNNVVDDPAYAVVRDEMVDRLIAHLSEYEDQFQFDRAGIAAHAPGGLPWRVPWIRKT